MSWDERLERLLLSEQTEIEKQGLLSFSEKFDNCLTNFSIEKTSVLKMEPQE
jgi:hypothetical protein